MVGNLSEHIRPSTEKVYLKIQGYFKRTTGNDYTGSWAAVRTIVKHRSDPASFGRRGIVVNVVNMIPLIIVIVIIVVIYMDFDNLNPILSRNWQTAEL